MAEQNNKTQNKQPTQADRINEEAKMINAQAKKQEALFKLIGAMNPGVKAGMSGIQKNIKQEADMASQQIGATQAGDNFLRNLMTSVGVGMAAAGGKESIAGGILNLAAKRQEAMQPPKMKPVFRMDPITGKLTLSGEVPEDGQVFEGSFTPEQVQERAKVKADVQVDKESRALAAKQAKQTELDYAKAKDKLKLTLSKFNDMVKETERLTGLKAGRPGGIATTALGALGINKKVQAFKGHLVETATAIAKIAAPSAKVGPDLIKLFSSTLPNNFSNMEEARDQILTSITNGMTNYAATHPEDFPEGFDADLFEKEMGNVLDEIIAEERKYKDNGKKKSSFKVLGEV